MQIPPVPSSSTPSIHPAFLHDRYRLKKKMLKLIGASFAISDASGTQVLQANQKGFKLKEDIRILGGAGMTQELLAIQARQIMDFSAAYDVVDVTTNAKVGALKRKGLKSMLRDEWVILDAFDREIGTLIEDNLALALVRRFLSNLVPQNYDAIVNGQRVVDFKQNFHLLTYDLNVVFEVPAAQFDRRLGIAAAVLLAAIEGKQKS